MFEKFKMPFYILMDEAGSQDNPGGGDPGTENPAENNNPENNPSVEDENNPADEIADKFQEIVNKKDEDRTDEEKAFFEANKDDFDIEEDVTSNYHEKLGQVLGEDVPQDIIKEGKPEEIAQFIANRDVALREMHHREVFDELNRKSPEAYQDMLYILRGGDYNSIRSGIRQSFDSIEDTDTGRQQARLVIQEDLKTRGVEERMIPILLKDYEDNALLVAKANEIQDERNKESEQSRLAQIKAQEDAQIRAKQAQQSLVNDIKRKVIDEGVVKDWSVSFKDRQDFLTDFVGRLDMIENGKFVYELEFNPNEFEDVMQVAFFNFKGGKLEEFVNRAATTVATKNIKRVVRKSKNNQNGGSNVRETRISLEDFRKKY